MDPDEDEPPGESSDDELFESSEDEDPDAEDVEPELDELVLAVVLVPLERAAMPPARPRNVRALRTPATIRDRPAACRRFGRSRDAGDAGDAGGICGAG